MNNFRKEVPFPVTVFGRLALSFVLTISLAAIIFVTQAYFESGGLISVCDGVGGYSQSESCYFFQSGFENFASLLAISSYFLMMPIIVPSLVVWLIIEIAYRSSRKRNEN